MTSAIRLAHRAVMALALTQCIACGGGGGGGGGQANTSRTTTFIGQLSQASERGGDLTTGGGAQSVVQVCVDGTSFCTEVDPTGAFTLAADVGGIVVLVFDGPDFTASLSLSDVPRGATIRIDDIVCSVISGQCRAADIDIIGVLNAPPDCSAASASPAVLWPPNHALVPIDIVGVADPDDDDLLITATDFSQNEAVDEPGSGNTDPDVQLDPLAVRAERSGQGNGRTYVITFVAEDDDGESCTGTVEVCVPHDQGQGDSCG